MDRLVPARSEGPAKKVSLIIKGILLPHSRNADILKTVFGQLEIAQERIQVGENLDPIPQQSPHDVRLLKHS